MIKPLHGPLSVVRQCALVGVNRSGVYHRSLCESAETLALMRLIDEVFLEHPFYGARQMMLHLRKRGYRLGLHRVHRLMGKMSLAPIYQRPRNSLLHPQNPVYPYLLRNLVITRPQPALVC
jgi:putative transposase